MEFGPLNVAKWPTCPARGIRATDAGKDAVVLGWVAKRRDLGNLLFLDVRDRTGIVQVVFNKETQPEAHGKADHVRSEYVVAVEGKVINIKEIEALATLPSKEELVSKLLFLINAPAQRLVTVMNAVGKDLAVVINQGVEKKKFKEA